MSRRQILKNQTYASARSGDINMKTNNPSSKLVKEFLRESNYIERVYDDVALEDAYTSWKYAMKQDEISLLMVLRIHKKLLERVDPRIAGKMRMVDVRVGPRICPPWENVYGLLAEWVKLYKDAKTFDEIMAAHIAFERVHPFEDANGRTGRILMNWQMLKNGLPLHVIHTGDEQMAYYRLFEE